MTIHPQLPPIQPEGMDLKAHIDANTEATTQPPNKPPMPQEGGITTPKNYQHINDNLYLDTTSGNFVEWSPQTGTAPQVDTRPWYHSTLVTMNNYIDNGPSAVKGWLHNFFNKQ